MSKLSFAGAALAAILASGMTMAQVNCATGPRVAVGVSPPPPLAEQVQPPIPGYGYVWTPGYWAWNVSVNDYYWAPGVWVMPPRIGYLWTPPWWGWNDGVYLFNAGYWGQSIGWYGGVDYGYGYYGHGYEGGYWQGNTFWYNSRVNNLGGARFNAVYDRSYAGRNFSHVSYNGGPGGLRERPTAREMSAAREAHIGPTPGQASHNQSAALNTAYRAGPNHGHPILVAAGGAVAGAAAMHAISHHVTQAHARGAEVARGERFAGARVRVHEGPHGGYAGGRAFAHPADRQNFAHREAFRPPVQRVEAVRRAPEHAAPAFHAAPAARPMPAPRRGAEGQHH